MDFFAIRIDFIYSESNPVFMELRTDQEGNEYPDDKEAAFGLFRETDGQADLFHLFSLVCCNFCHASV